MCVRYNETGGNLTAYKEQYIQLYVDLIKPIVNAEDPTRSYLVSSPSNGIKSEEDGYFSNEPDSALYGDSKSFLNCLELFTNNAFSHFSSLLQLHP
jgi:hypothetical protein